MISVFFIEFIIYSFLGWIWECTYCTYKEHKWQNRGFLYGPVVPIYGAGAVTARIVFTKIPALTGLAEASSNTLAGTSFSSDTVIPVLKLFLICALGSAVLEYGTSYVLEKRFHARWWDYRDMPLNLNGRICLPATLLFGIAGVAVIKWLTPLAGRAEAFLHPLAAELIALILMWVFAADTALTVASLTQLVSRLELFESEFNEAMEARYQTISGTPAYLKEKQQELIDKAQSEKQQLIETAKDKQNELIETTQKFRRSLSSRQQYVLRNIRRFTTGTRNILTGKNELQDPNEGVSRNETRK